MNDVLSSGDTFLVSHQSRDGWQSLYPRCNTWKNVQKQAVRNVAVLIVLVAKVPGYILRRDNTSALNVTALCVTYIGIDTKAKLDHCERGQ